MPQNNKENLEDVNMEPVGLGTTRVLIDYVQKSLRILDYYPPECESNDCVWVGCVLVWLQERILRSRVFKIDGTAHSN